MDLTAYKQKILSTLDTRGGMTTGDVAANVVPVFGHNRRIHSGAVRQWLLELKAAGLVRELDDQKPVCWVRIPLSAFQVDDETIYAAIDSEQAAVLYEQDTGAACEQPDYPRALSDAELDASVPELDENERLTGRETSVRVFLAAATEPGMIACNV